MITSANDLFPLKWLIYWFEEDKYYNLLYSSFGIKIILHTKENGHNIPHIHVQYQGEEVVLNIDNGEIIAGNIPKSKYKIAKQWVKDNREYINSMWVKLSHGVTI